MANDEWTSLFDGETLNGWKATGNPDGWVVEDGTIACLAQGGGYLYTEKAYENYELRIDWKIAPGCNSGIFFQWSNLNDPVHTGLEMQILDTPGENRVGKHDCGALYELVPPAKQTMKPAGEWNSTTIVCDSSDIRIDLNGETVVEADISQWTKPNENPDGSRTKFRNAWADLPRKGHIGLQDHGGKVWFENINIREF